MENYTKGDNVSFAEDTKEDVLTELRQVLSEQIHSDFKVISVKPGSKLRNLTPAAINQFKTQGLTVLIGSGVAVSKVAAFGELLRKRLNSVTQWNSIRFTSQEEYWNPKDHDQLEKLKVVRQIPFMSVVLIKSESVDAISPLKNWTMQTDLSTFLNSATERKTRKRHRPKRNVK